jgi:hypothetical protein
MKIPKLTFSSNLFITILLSLFQLVLIFKTEIIYIPILLTLLSSFFYGLFEPKKGWILAVVQISLLLLGYWGLIYFDVKAKQEDMAVFATHISIFPTFVASFLGSFIRRM